ncbi:hypothetical protein TOPH_04360 [Tolypocladium ophioglossoides CBS 100239]|uniref:Uncharacterized protein n=1 Tax=Tolypocladium ophioglossoides (strain CBS 100239) TaxID=1163406 RepID=A0A0L0NA55_TOLOC|nr:hypothetical protein TOPH_04360 [Tolypocladium ophioglossoides CBS 100239]
MGTHAVRDSGYVASDTAPASRLETPPWLGSQPSKPPNWPRLASSVQSTPASIEAARQRTARQRQVWQPHLPLPTALAFQVPRTASTGPLFISPQRTAAWVVCPAQCTHTTSLGTFNSAERGGIHPFSIPSPSLLHPPAIPSICAPVTTMTAPGFGHAAAQTNQPTLWFPFACQGVQHIIDHINPPIPFAVPPLRRVLPSSVANSRLPTHATTTPHHPFIRAPEQPTRQPPAPRLSHRQPWCPRHRTNNKPWPAHPPARKPRRRRLARTRASPSPLFVIRQSVPPVGTPQNALQSTRPDSGIQEKSTLPVQK